jgi:hypothetical protein
MHIQNPRKVLGLRGIDHEVEIQLFHEIELSIIRSKFLIIDLIS